MENIKFRKAKISDFDVILDLVSQLWDTESIISDILNKDYYKTEKAKEHLLKDIKSKKLMFIVAVLDKKVIGMADGYILKEENAYNKKIAHLDRLVVDKNYRGKGIGKELIEEFSARMKKKGCNYVKLNAFEENLPAVKCYLNNGFKEYSIYYMKEI